MNIALFALMVTVILANYGVKDRTGDLEKSLTRIESDIKKEIDAIKMARAEWAFLNQADRIQALSKEHLSLSGSTPLRSFLPMSSSRWLGFAKERNREKRVIPNT